jgi:hypothetical protein
MNPIIDFLIIAIDSEEMTYEEKYSEIVEFIHDKIDISKVKIIIQHFCLETWALGNKVIHKRNPQNAKLREFIRHFNAEINDPEFMPAFDRYNLSRSQFAINYLKLSLQEKYSRLFYTKTSPEIISDPKYFKKIRERYEIDSHIKSFGKFLDAF